MNHRLPHRIALTLIEVLAVVVILAMLALTLTVGIVAKMGKAKQELAKTQITQIVGQVQAYQVEKGAPPPAGKGLAVLSERSTAIYYLEPAKLRDPWGNPYRYLVPGPKGAAYDIVTYGADNKPGGADDQADISSSSLSE